MLLRAVFYVDIFSLSVDNSENEKNGSFMLFLILLTIFSTLSTLSTKTHKPRIYGVFRKINYFFFENPMLYFILLK